jgi:hypothetical protein
MSGAPHVWTLLEVQGGGVSDDAFAHLLVVAREYSIVAVLPGLRFSAAWLCLVLLLGLVCVRCCWHAGLVLLRRVARDLLVQWCRFSEE